MKDSNNILIDDEIFIFSSLIIKSNIKYNILNKKIYINRKKNLH